MATKAVSENTGRIRFFIDNITTGVVRDVSGKIAVFIFVKQVASLAYFLDVLTGEIYIVSGD